MICWHQNPGNFRGVLRFFFSARAFIFHHLQKLAFGSDNVLDGENSRSPQKESFAMTRESCLASGTSWSSRQHPANFLSVTSS